jgi:hypothetical protein
MEVRKGKYKLVQIPALWVRFTESYEEEVLKKLKDEGLIPSIIVNSPECIFFWILRKLWGKKK